MQNHPVLMPVSQNLQFQFTRDGTPQGTAAQGVLDNCYEHLVKYKDMSNLAHKHVKKGCPASGENLTGAVACGVDNPEIFAISGYDKMQIVKKVLDLAGHMGHAMKDGGPLDFVPGDGKITGVYYCSHAEKQVYVVLNAEVNVTMVRIMVSQRCCDNCQSFLKDAAMYKKQSIELYAPGCPDLVFKSA